MKQVLSFSHSFYIKRWRLRELPSPNSQNPGLGNFPFFPLLSHESSRVLFCLFKCSGYVAKVPFSRKSIFIERLWYLPIPVVILNDFFSPVNNTNVNYRKSKKTCFKITTQITPRNNLMYFFSVSAYKYTHTHRSTIDCYPRSYPILSSLVNV